MDELIERLKDEAGGYGDGPTTLTNGEIVELRSLLREAAAALEAAREDACVALVADIRFACGDNGKRMQPELVEFIRGLTEDAERYRFIAADHSSAWEEELDAAIDAAWRAG